MAPEENPLELLGREADERLLDEELPAGVSQPPAPLAESAARRQVVRFGAAMTGVTLIGGLGLAVAGVVELVADGSAAWIVLLVLGLVLATTHWGWVHVAELSGNAIEARRNASLEQRRRAWLAEIEPYTRWEVSTSAGEDGSITVLTVRHRPTPSGQHTFTFVREEVARELHAADEPAAVVAERAELLRRNAAADTRAAQQEFEAARDAYEQALMARDDEQQRRLALRAASEALSQRINANLRDPPLTE